MESLRQKLKEKDQSIKEKDQSLKEKDQVISSLKSAQVTTVANPLIKEVNEEMKKRIEGSVKDGPLWRTMKFITDDNDKLRASKIVYDHIYGRPTKAEEEVDKTTWITQYSFYVKQALNVKRNRVLGSFRDKCRASWKIIQTTLVDYPMMDWLENVQQGSWISKYQNNCGDAVL